MEELASAGRARANLLAITGSDMLMLGEVSTGLLRHSTPVTSQASTDILRLRPGEPVRRSTRPIAYVRSPELLTGVDCRLPTESGTATRGIGTVASHAMLTGGRVLQGSAHTIVVVAGSDHRQPWSHYLSRPGFVERVGRVTTADLTLGFTATGHRPDSLDLAAIANRTMDAVQAVNDLDGVPPMRTARTRLRWLAATADDAVRDEPVSLRIEDDIHRTLVIRVPDGTAQYPERVAGFCEDLALHDWLLTVLLKQVESSRLGHDDPARALQRLRPAIESLLHLWMPAARLDPNLERLWRGLERRAGFGRQWTATVERIRGAALLATGVPA
jgi:hypothetical protein